MEMKFFKCGSCGKIIAVIKKTAAATICCGQEMTELVPGISGDSGKHMPLFQIEGNTVRVTVSEKVHPMEEAHFIEWIAVQTKKGFQQKFLRPGDSPSAEFILSGDDSLEAVYAYCNLHGLWMNR